jgi:hypothetical protein
MRGSLASRYPRGENYFGDGKPGDVSHSFMREAVLACPALRIGSLTKLAIGTDFWFPVSPVPDTFQLRTTGLSDAETHARRSGQALAIGRFDTNASGGNIQGEAGVRADVPRRASGASERRFRGLTF